MRISDEESPPELPRWLAILLIVVVVVLYARPLAGLLLLVIRGRNG